MPEEQRHQQDVQELEARIGHRFRRAELLTRALTHKSLTSGKGAADEPLADNEQLEFLGDSVLGFLASEALVERFAGFREGRLSKIKAHLVSEAHLFIVAQRLDVGRFLILGRGEELTGGRMKRALLADAMEALIAALYLDGGIEVARAFVRGCIFGGFDFDGAGLPPIEDFKSALQERAQALKLPQPRYAIVKEHGPEHAKTFIVEARVGKTFTSQADGMSKKAAGQKAAALVLRQLDEAAGGAAPPG
jgi:ribonuclease III